jgi:tRNA threonylcarbamoyladenosine biosynthesis protein TsaE
VPILDPLSFECVSHSEEQTQRLGARLAMFLPAVCVVALQGDLGAGKTHFARGVGVGWGAAQELRKP